METANLSVFDWYSLLHESSQHCWTNLQSCHARAFAMVIAPMFLYWLLGNMLTWAVYMCIAAASWQPIDLGFQRQTVKTTRGHFKHPPASSEIKEECSEQHHNADLFKTTVQHVHANLTAFASNSP
jgi:hypothetical protein